MRDILPDEQPLFQRVVSAFAELAERYGYRQITTPILEHAELIERTAGQARSETASAIATAAMFTMRRTVDDGVRICAGFAAPSRMPPTVSPCPAAIRNRL